MADKKEPPLEGLLRNIRLKKVLLFIKSKDIVCDIGCGHSATLLKSIKPFIKQGYGIDKKIYLKSEDNIILTNGDLSKKLPFKDNFFDVITMLAVLEHIEKPDRLLAEVSRILKEKGLIVITVPTVFAKPVLEFFAFKLRILSLDEIKDHKNYFKKNELGSLLKGEGFVLKKYKYFELFMNTLVIAEKY